MAAAKILVVEDEAPIREMIAFHLTRAGFSVLEAGNCKDARIVLADDRPDLLIVDWMLPDMSGLELTRLIKRAPETQDLSIIMLTAKASEQDKVLGLEGGADDYVTKPFSSRELIARINAVLRRSTTTTTDSHEQGLLALDPVAHRVLINGNEVSFGPKEYKLLQFLMTHPERVYSRAQLLDRVWGGNVYVEERTVDVHVTRLRKSLARFGIEHYIQTVRGAGYRFSTQSD